MSEEQASLQLSALAEVSDSLQTAEIDYWLFGGWAVDFYVDDYRNTHHLWQMPSISS